MQINRTFFICSIVFILFLVLITRLFYLQIIDGGFLSKAASKERIGSSEVDDERGEILDRNGIPFTDRDEKVTLVLKPDILRGKDNDIESISKILDIDTDKLKRQISEKSDPIIINTQDEKRSSILNMKIQGINIIYSLLRSGNSTLAKHIIGYLNKADFKGESGIEKAYEKELGNYKVSSVGVVTDAKNNVLPGLGYRLSQTNPEGKKLNIKLTLDYHIQKIAEDAMGKNNTTGAMVVEDVVNGDIVAMVSKPDFDPNSVEKYLKSDNKELFNRAVASYNLGSIFKIIDAAQVFESDGNLQYEQYYCPGYIYVGDKQYKCSTFEKGGHGNIGLEDAFALSCNSYFINLGIKLGSKNLINMAEKFGLGKNTGICSQGIEESSGNLPINKGFFSDGDTANISIGQGDILATPLQVADMVATVANGGIKNRINLVDSVLDENGSVIKNLRVNEGERIISIESSNRIKNLMESVTKNGTGTKANLDQYGGSAGKTGSAETGEFENGEKVVQAWFAGYFPIKNPKYSIAVLVENGQNGGQIAAPIFETAAEEIMKKGY